MLHTLYGKLAAALLALVVVLSTLFVTLTVATTQRHFQQVSQSLNAALAGNVVTDRLMQPDHSIDNDAFKETFDQLMHINPSVEMYLVDQDGVLLAFSAPPGSVARDTIALEPVLEFLAPNPQYPILGDDPRDERRRKIFSAAPLRLGDELAGYLYVVLGGEQQDALTRALQGNFLLRLSAGVAATGVLLTVLAGLFSFNWLTRRLRRLADTMEAFRRNGFRQAVALPDWRREDGDEIDKLGQTFEQMSARMIDQIEQLEKVDEQRRDLFANVSHDLRTPLASLQGYLETLAIKEDAISAAERKEYLELALRHSRRLGRLIGELFELATLERDDASAAFEAFSMGELVQDVAQKFRLTAAQRDLTLETEICAAPTFVRGDIGQMERVLDNLIENAIKFTPAGGTVRVVLDSGPDGVGLRVSDTGQGIPAEFRERIFDRFFRVAPETSGAEGTGLGLAIVQRTVQLHGSDVDVQSEPGAGTTFSFRLENA